MFNIPYDDIINKIKKEKGLSEEEIQKRINSKLQQLSGLISKEGAAHIVANELGINLYEDITKRRLKIENLVLGMKNFTIAGRAIRIYEIREFNSNGKKGKVGSFMLADNTGFIKVVVWGHKADLIKELKELDSIRIKDGFVKENNGYKELHLNDRSQIEIKPEDEDLPLINPPLNKKFNQRPTKRSLIKDLKENDIAELLGTIVQVFEPRFYASCPQCFRKVELRNDTSYCNEHGYVNERMVPIVNLIFDDGTDTIRMVCFRSQAEMLMGLTDEKIHGLKENISDFESIKKVTLGRCIFVVGRARKNEFFGRMEFIVQNVYEADPKELAEELLHNLQ